MNALPTLLLFPLLPLLASAAPAQDPDWAKDVERACTSPRYGLRLAAAKKLAAGGAAPLAAIDAFAKAHGANELPASLVEAIADLGTDEDAVIDHLRTWALDRDFYWRATALRGLAKRAPRLPAKAVPLQTLFTSLTDDPAWLVRTHARLGLCLLGHPDAADVPDDDPRAVRKLAALRLQAGQLPALQPLLDALGDGRTMLGDPWAQRTAAEAFAALQGWLGGEGRLPDGADSAERRDVVMALLTKVKAKSGQDLRAPALRADGPAAAGGIEVLSCRSGDVFVQWNDAGELRLGISGDDVVTLPAGDWQRLAAARNALPTDGEPGIVVCDSLRVRWSGAPEVHRKFAPKSLPAATVGWLGQLAAEIDKAGRAKAAAGLRAAMEQFGKG